MLLSSLYELNRSYRWKRDSILSTSCFCGTCTCRVFTPVTYILGPGIDSSQGFWKWPNIIWLLAIALETNTSKRDFNQSKVNTKAINILSYQTYLLYILPDVLPMSYWQTIKLTTYGDNSPLRASSRPQAWLQTTWPWAASGIPATSPAPREASGGGCLLSALPFFAKRPPKSKLKRSFFFLWVFKKLLKTNCWVFVGSFHQMKLSKWNQTKKIGQGKYWDCIKMAMGHKTDTPLGVRHLGLVNGTYEQSMWCLGMGYWTSVIQHLLNDLHFITFWKQKHQTKCPKDYVVGPGPELNFQTLLLPAVNLLTSKKLNGIKGISLF